MPAFARVLVCAWMVLLSGTAAGEAILVMGDSLSSGFGLQPGNNWVVLLQNKLDRAQKGYQLVNASIAGETTRGGLARIEPLLRRHKPAIVILELGGNDGLRGFPPRLIENNLRRIIERARDHHAQVLLVGMRMPPNYGHRYTEKFHQLYQILAEQMGIPFIPFLLEGIGPRPELMQHDRTHPNDKAQPLIADIVWKHLEPLLSRNQKIGSALAN